MNQPDQSDDILDLTLKALDPDTIAAKKCFLCGGTATTGKGEHVFPQWLQQRFNIRDRTLNLLNGTTIPYRNLRVPACANCNNNLLGKTENYVSKLSDKSVSNWNVAHSFEVARWMAKLFIGILIKEANLLLDRGDERLGMIFPHKALKELQLLHLLVQSWRKRIKFKSLHTTHPFTLYVYEIEEDPAYDQFNFSTNLVGKSVCIRLGSIGFAFVGDGGLQHHCSELGPYRLAFNKLHPIQFDEIAATVHYKAVLRDATHLYLHHETSAEFRFEQLRVVPYSPERLENGEMVVFKEWSNKDFARVLKGYGVPGWPLLLNDDGEAVYTFLVDQDGNKLNLSSLSA